MSEFNPIDHLISITRPSRLVRPDSWSEHTPFAMFLVDILRPGLLVELGTHTGNSYCAFCQAVKELNTGTKCFAVDTWEGDPHAGYYGAEVLAHLQSFHDPLYGEFSKLLQSTFDDAVGQFKDGSIDVLHIDGLHTYEAVKHDFETWLSKVSAQGVVLFHDIAVHEADFGVWRLWQELKATYPSFEFLYGNGLGILAVGKAYPPSLDILLRATPAEAAKIQSFFHELGIRAETELNTTAIVQDQLHAERQALADVERALRAVEQRTNELFNRKSWRFALFLASIRYRLVPANSWGERLAVSLYQAFRRWRNDGTKAMLWSLAKYFTKLDSYAAWIMENEPGARALSRQRKAAKKLEQRPLISIVTPVYNPSLAVLQATIDSVIGQTYDNWELCIANGSQDSAEIREALASNTRKDPRIKVLDLEKNLGIAGNTNAAINLARGDFVGFLDHDDLLAPFALFEVAQTITGDSSVDLIFSDEDKVEADGQGRHDPFFKPAFSPDLLRSVNYMCHFLVVRRSLGEQLGWIREGFEGSQDYDFVLRAAERAAKIAHIPRVLYHWRALASSTALDTNAKDYATSSGIKALEGHLQRMDLAGTVSQGFAPTRYRLTYGLTRSPLVSIIIPNSDHAGMLGLCVDSIQKNSSYREFEILIVENNSQQEATFLLYKALQRYPNVRLVNYERQPFNYSEVNNYAATCARGELLLFLNNDIEAINPDWLERMVEHAIRPEVGAVGAKLYYPNDTIQHAGVIVGLGGVAGHSHKHAPRASAGQFGRLMMAQNLSAVTAACLMTRREIFEQVQGFDPRFQLAFGDVDLCMKMRDRGYLVVWTPYAELYHRESITRGYEDNEEKRRRFRREMGLFLKKWPAFLARGDEYYNPNLTLAREDFSLRGGRVKASVRISAGFPNPVSGGAAPEAVKTMNAGGGG